MVERVAVKVVGKVKGKLAGKVTCKVIGKVNWVAKRPGKIAGKA